MQAYWLKIPIIKREALQSNSYTDWIRALTYKYGETKSVNFKKQD